MIAFFFFYIKYIFRYSYRGLFMWRDFRFRWEIFLEYCLCGVNKSINESVLSSIKVLPFNFVKAQVHEAAWRGNGFNRVRLSRRDRPYMAHDYLARKCEHLRVICMVSSLCPTSYRAITHGLGSYYAQMLTYPC